MHTIGYPAGYRPEYCQLAHNYCLLAANRGELADFLDVELDTILTWMVNFPAFAKAVRAGNAATRGQQKTLTRTVQCRPDTCAAIYWLENSEDPAAPAGHEIDSKKSPRLADSIRPDSTRETGFRSGLYWLSFEYNTTSK